MEPVDVTLQKSMSRIRHVVCPPSQRCGQTNHEEMRISQSRDDPRTGALPKKDGFLAAQPVRSLRSAVVSLCQTAFISVTIVMDEDTMRALPLRCVPHHRTPISRTIHRTILPSHGNNHQWYCAHASTRRYSHQPRQLRD
jgi:hypothetical protein